MSDAAYPRRWWALPVVLSATFLALFDLFVVNVAAPSIRHDLHASPAGLQLVIAGYAFTYAVGLITGGRLGDLAGRRRMFLTGMAVFTAASLLCAVAASTPLLVGARLVQGAGAAVMIPQVLALIQVMFAPGERPSALAWFGAVAGLGAVAGQLAGGVLLAVDAFDLGWRAVFVIQLPVGLAALLAGQRLLPATGGTRTQRLDPLGALLLTAGLGLILLPLTLGRQAGWPPWALGCLLASVPVLGLFAWSQRHAASPLIDVALFGSRAFTAGLAVNLAFYANVSSFFLVVSLYLQDGLGLAPLTAGLTFAPLGAGFAASSLLGRGLVARYGRPVLSGGVAIVLATLTAGLVLVIVQGTGMTALRFAAVMLLVGLGNGLVLPATLNVVLSGVDPRLGGVAAGVLTTAQQFGGALGVAGIGVAFFGVLGEDPTAGGDAYVTATAAALAVDIALTLLVLALTFLLPGHSRPSATTSGQQRRPRRVPPSAIR